MVAQLVRTAFAPDESNPISNAARIVAEPDMTCSDCASDVP